MSDHFDRACKRIADLEMGLQNLLTFTHASTRAGREAQAQATQLLNPRAVPVRSQPLTREELMACLLCIDTATSIALYKALKELP